jgi:hypothetical protein
MSDPIRAYLDATKKYDEWRIKAQYIINTIHGVGDAMSYKLEDFLSLTYSLPIPRPANERFRRFDDSARFDMKGWSSADDIHTVMINWHEAFMQLHRTWTQVAAEDQKGIKPPPKTLSPN